MSAGLSLYPEFLPASAVIGHLSRLDGLVERLFIHISQHQNLLGLKMLDDHRNQPLFIRLEFREFQHTLKRGHLNPFLFTLLLKSGKIHIRLADKPAG